MVELPDVPVSAATPEVPATPEAAPNAPAADNPTGAPAADATAASSTPSPSTPVNAAPGDEPKFEIKVDGKVELLTRAEMIALAQQGKSFTQKSQRLADEQRRWESDRQVILRQEREAAIREHTQKIEREKAEAAKDPNVRAMERVASLEQKLEDQQLEVVLKSLLERHGVDEQQFLIEASRAGLRTVADVQARGEEIAKALSEKQNGSFEARFKDVLSKGEHPELKTLQQKWLADYLKTKTAGPTPPSSTVAPSSPAAPKRARTLDEAADIAHEMLTGHAPQS